MRGLGGSTLRGGQTVFHGLRMWGQLVQAAMMLAAFMTVAVPAWSLWRSTSGAEWYAAGMYSLAEVKLVLGYEPDSGQEIRFPDGTRRVLTIRDIASSVPAWEARERIKAEMFASAWLGAKAGLGVIALFLAWFWYRGVQLSRQRRIRGAELVTARELRRQVRPVHLRARDRMPGWKELRPYRIAGIPYPERTETQHTIVSGTTGSGKTVLITDLVAQIRARGERCVIYDKMGSYTAAFLDPVRDVLMNPLDARAPRWSPFLEARNPRDFDMMAAALIPQQKDTVDPFWVTAARQLFSNGAGVFWKKGVTENRVLVDHLLKTDLTALAEAMEGTVAQSIVDPENPKTALSVRAMLTANLSALEFLPDTGKPFSIREWISDDDGGGFLFLTSRGDQHASLRGLISTWLEIAVNAMLSLSQSDGRRIWVILDELPTLHQVPSLQPGLAESRQFGGCFVLGVQVASALRDLYGRNGAETIIGALRHARRAGRAGPRHRPVVGRQPRAERDRGGGRGLFLRRQHHPRRRLAHAPARAALARAPLRDHAAPEPGRLSQVPRPAPGRLHPPQIREPPRLGPRASWRAGPMQARPMQAATHPARRLRHRRSRPRSRRTGSDRASSTCSASRTVPARAPARAGPPPASGADNGGEETDSEWEARADGETGAAAPPGEAAADGKSAPAAPPDPAPARPDADVPGGLMRF